VETASVPNSLRVWAVEEYAMQWIRGRNGSRLKRNRKPYSTLFSKAHVVGPQSAWRRKSRGTPLAARSCKGVDLQCAGLGWWRDVVERWSAGNVESLLGRNWSGKEVATKLCGNVEQRQKLISGGEGFGNDKGLWKRLWL